MTRRGRKRAVAISPMKPKAVHDEDPGEDRRQSLNHEEEAAVSDSGRRRSAPTAAVPPASPPPAAPGAVPSAAALPRAPTTAPPSSPRRSPPASFVFYQLPIPQPQACPGNHGQNCILSLGCVSPIDSDFPDITTSAVTASEPESLDPLPENRFVILRRAEGVPAREVFGFEAQFEGEGREVFDSGGSVRE